MFEDCAVPARILESYAYIVYGDVLIDLPAVGHLGLAAFDDFYAGRRWVETLIIQVCVLDAVLHCIPFEDERIGCDVIFAVVIDDGDV